MGYSGFLGFLDDLGLRLCHGRHEGDQGVADGLRHRVLGSAVEGQPVDDGFDDNSPPNEFPDGVGHIGVVSPEAVHPSHHEGIPCPEHVEQPFPLWALSQSRPDARYGVVRDHFIESESHPLGLGALVLQGLISGADAAIKNRLHVLSSRLLSALGSIPMGNPTPADGPGGLFWMTSGPCPCGQSRKPIYRSGHWIGQRYRYMVTVPYFGKKRLNGDPCDEIAS